MSENETIANKLLHYTDGISRHEQVLSMGAGASLCGYGIDTHDRACSQQEFDMVNRADGCVKSQ
jgi:hypothetical protein